MTKAEFTAWMDEYFGVGKQADGSQTSKIGRDALSQGIPQGDGQPGDPRWPAYKVIGDIRRILVDTKKQLSQVAADVAALKSKA